MSWMPFVEYCVYALLGIATFVLWWLIYEWVLTRGISVRDAVFGPRPNAAVALDLAGGFLAIGLLDAAIINGPPLVPFWLDVEAVALRLVGLVLALGVLRWLAAGFLRAWFGNRRDAQGDVITLNNELFRQRNLATGLFAVALYLILVAGLMEVDLLDMSGFRGASLLNMLGVWLTGLVTLAVHSWFFLGIGGRRNLLHESFHDNHPAAPTSALGLLLGVLLLNHVLLGQLPPGVHWFAVPWHWLFLLLAMASVLIVRGLLQLALLGVAGVSLRVELVRGNPAWGILDAGLILALMLILIALIA